MKSVVILVTCLAVASCAWAVDLGNRAPAKPADTTTAPPADPDVVRQGGDTVETATPVTIPYSGTGTTTGYSDDYSHDCPYGNTSPDVVYTFIADQNMTVDIDLCGSLYDTAVFVYDADWNYIACNDDFYGGEPCGIYVSKIEEIPVAAGIQYNVFVEGYGSDYGDYVIQITEHEPCTVGCPAGAELEGEPPLVDDYVDMHNGGCNTDLDNPPFQPLAAEVFCGTSGFYLSGDSEFRDTDWFITAIPSSGSLEIVGDAEEACYMLELGPQDCNAVGVIQNVVIGPCSEATMVINGNPGDPVWFWVGPTTFSSPWGSPYEFDYVLTTNLDPVATEAHSWTAVKGLFD